jgi:hypothetical protein
MSELNTRLKEFQDYLLGNTWDIAKAVQAPKSPKTFAKKRLGIYGDAYFLRLLGLLQLEFPALFKYVGEDEFETLIYEYLDVFPSRSPSARYIGQNLSRFLAETFPYCQQQPMLSELAAFEWALTAALVLPDAPILTSEALSSVPESAWPGIRFALHPSAQQLTLHWNAPDIRTDAASTPIRHTSPISWVVWRKGIMPYYLPLSSEEARLLQGIANGCSFEELCQGLCESLPEDQVASYIVQRLLRWLNEEMLSEIILP